MTPARIRSPHHRRQDPRCLIELPVTLANKRPYLALSTWDVSARGLFLRTPNPLEIRQLVRMFVILPPTGNLVILHGMVTNVVGVDDPEDRPQGMGVELYALDAETRGAWWDMVRFVRDGGDAPSSDDARSSVQFRRADSA